jgi:hypothetical protein
MMRRISSALAIVLAASLGVLAGGPALGRTEASRAQQGSTPAQKAQPQDSAKQKQPIVDTSKKMTTKQQCYQQCLSKPQHSGCFSAGSVLSPAQQQACCKQKCGL